MSQCWGKKPNSVFPQDAWVPCYRAFPKSGSQSFGQRRINSMQESRDQAWEWVKTVRAVERVLGGRNSQAPWDHVQHSAQCLTCTEHSGDALWWWSLLCMTLGKSQAFCVSLPSYAEDR